ncbi:hypothetical protein HNY73_010167 [Argiope bruennichi]|uniref:Uncharacterized protein n=1 Tax=Argiope bruennichi TaxID=94029 RepID=A0A8T0F2H7_ARGBR|nr:hypothetical protein HNY73_010167 [Argiope bruennichi]
MSPMTKVGATTFSPNRNKFDVEPLHASAGNVTLPYFFDHKEVDFLKNGTGVNAQRYSKTLTELRNAIKSKHLNKLSCGVIFAQQR